jgi:23S rRNA pseudouridine2605 synthase
MATAQRIAKLIARSGLCSRRDAEKLIAQGVVALDGEPVITPGTTATIDQEITVSGKPLPKLQALQLYQFYKPKGVVTTKKDPQGRTTIYDVLPPALSHLIYVGRLDYNSEGLLLLTNDGGFSRTLEHPTTGLKRTYRVRTHGVLDPNALKRLTKGVTLNGIHYAPLELTIERQGASNHWLTMTLTEGKNREIRKLLESVGLTVDRLIRTHYGPVTLGGLKPGEVLQVPNPEWLFTRENA